MLRALLLAIVAWSLVRFLLRLFRISRPAPGPGPGPAPEPAPGPARSREEALSTGILVQDKVCGTFIDQQSALTAMDLQGEKVYFCSEACLGSWRASRSD
jgi:YHS domain-containing protein